ncbi:MULTISPECIES: FadR/GntR family transcriptional regulator [unclassified Sedimentibacter]|uniref:FadR/GntR family transcriptional regulator n=1 Tax=unclassified Sedimentibacter TaxID=2649220 RepID=UPI0027DF7DC3|nr:FadR/GntR family transcriptional regulator [Sedimentibacter sp. MB35-C1]WMJ78116.1 FadR/GntR family transcriptional regulator [Sedimentibacter sp. MB35-C1]
MFTEIEPSEKVTNKILKQITQLIKDGELKPGEKLPPERQIAEMMGVSRPALKQTISILEAMGIVESRRGDGNYILPCQNKIFNPIILSFYAAHGNMDDILEVRYIIEVQNVKIAARKRTEEQLALLDEIISRMEGPKTLKERILLNNEFHLELIRITGNPLLINFYESIIDLIGEQITTTDGSDFYSTHKDIVEFIRDKNSDGAAKSILRHFGVKFPNFKYYAEDM